MPGLETIGELSAAYVRAHRVLVLADTHIGFEEEISSKGGYIPRFQLRNTLKILEEAFSSASIDRVVFAGDVKHIFSTLGRVEKLELSELLTYVKKRAGDVVVVRGNHDNFLPTMKKWFEFEIVDSYLLPPFLVVHGHKPLREEELRARSWKYLIMGHEHPSIALRDSIGFVGKFPCFLVGNIRSYEKKVVVLPAVGVYQTGSRVTLHRETYLSPIIRDDVEIETLKPVIAAPDVGVLEFPTLKELHDLMA